MMTFRLFKGSSQRLKDRIRVLSGLKTVQQPEDMHHTLDPTPRHPKPYINPEPPTGHPNPYINPERPTLNPPPQV